MTEGSQVCHSTGWPKGTRLCRGARDFQTQALYRMGFLSAPTDEAWMAKMIELGLLRRTETASVKEQTQAD
jgi:hypothetical protein